MISLVHIVKQKQTHGKERESDQLGYTADPKVRNFQAKRAVIPKEANTVTGQVLATEYS